jgi:hypothetical protein
MSAPRVELLLFRHADTAWREVIRPWLEEEQGRLQRSYVVVPTRGQAQGLKQRCLVEGIALLGVEFLSPGLARKKWLTLDRMGAEKPALGRELLLLGLHTIIERRLQTLALDAPERGVLKSLQSDPEGALDDFDELLKSGFRPADFPLPALREIFGELVSWTEELGYDFVARQSEVAALTALEASSARIGGRLLVYGLGAEMWGEFFNVAAFARRFENLTIVLPEPEFRGKKALDEAWIEMWEKILGVAAVAVDGEEPTETCERVATLWTGGARGSADRATVLVGRSRGEEMQIVAKEIRQLLAAGAENIAVVFPRSDAAHLRLARLLGDAEVDFVDLLETAGAAPIEVRTQRALLAFYEGGGRLEALLELWPWLRALGHTEQPPGITRDVCERLFDERQSHELALYREKLYDHLRPEWREVGRIADLLLPVWPTELTLMEALQRFGAACARFELGVPAGWAALEAFAKREQRPLPSSVIFTAVASFLPEKSPAASVQGKSGFARVTLTTRRRAEGLAWSHLILVESNAGVWPEPRSPSAWLTDEQRGELNGRSRFSLGLFTGDDRATLEKRGYAMLARDTRAGVIFSAALFNEEDPELKLAPNSWVERVLWAQGAGARESSLEQLFQQKVRSVDPRPVKFSGTDVQAWRATWQSRRDPLRAFDDYFLSVDPAWIRPTKLPARLIERAARDPAELWFEAVLTARRVGWEPFRRTRKKALGQLAHRVLAAALRTRPVEGGFGEKPSLHDARTKLDEELVQLRALWPADRYWDSFHAELATICADLLAKVFALEAGAYVAVELALPGGTTVPLGPAGPRLEVYGRMDLALLDRTEWRGAAVDIIDFKTGADAKLTAARMGREGASLQLGVYLAAAESLGASSGRVWMIKPQENPVSLDMAELPLALVKLEQLGRHLETGRYGALTAEQSEYSPAGYTWPLACAPIDEAVLRAKFAETFGKPDDLTEERDA